MKRPIKNVKILRRRGVMRVYLPLVMAIVRAVAMILDIYAVRSNSHFRASEAPSPTGVERIIYQHVRIAHPPLPSRSQALVPSQQESLCRTRATIAVYRVFDTVHWRLCLESCSSNPPRLIGNVHFTSYCSQVCNSCCACVLLVWAYRR